MRGSIAKFFGLTLVGLAAATSWIWAAGTGLATTVTVVSDMTLGPAASHGLIEVLSVLEDAGITIHRAATPNEATGSTLLLVGTKGQSRLVSEMIKGPDLSVLETAEALVIRSTELDRKPALLVGGADDRGLMYALLEIAQRISGNLDPSRPFQNIEDVSEKPDVTDRALSIYTMQQRYFESRLFDEAYWTRYFDLLAISRFNRFVVIFGYENGGYMAPPYAYFFDVEGFPEVRVEGLTGAKQKQNLAALNRMIEIAHSRGLEFTAGIWDHIYRAGVQSGGVKDADGKSPTPGLVWGLTNDNLVPYSIAALKEFFRQVPKLDSIQFRMHGESGLERSEMGEFWKNLYQVVKESRPDIRFDARAKNFPDHLIELALEMGINIRICTKYWMEQMGLPFHPTHIHPRNQKDRRHGYADLLRYPRKYKMHWRLWNGGTSRILLWGDPDYARRFAQSTHLYDGEGFEVNEPLATKMEAQPHDLQPFQLIKSDYQYYDYEFERYWHFYQAFGRLGYNPDTSPSVWRREFEARFGAESAPFVEEALHLASRILPMITAYCYPYNHFPTTRGWDEKQRQENLGTYAEALPSDTQQFLGPSEAAMLYLKGEDSANRDPEESSKWFAGISHEVLRRVTQAEKLSGNSRNKEFESTLVDLRILAHLATYHSYRARGGFHYALFKASKDVNALDRALEYESQAIRAWQDLVRAAGDVYADDLMMGLRRMGLSGHWKDELEDLDDGLSALNDERAQALLTSGQETEAIRHVPVRRLRVGEDLVLRATVLRQSEKSQVRARYRKGGSEFQYQTMQPTEPGLYQTSIPAAKNIDSLEYYLEVHTSAGHTIQFPPEGKDAPIGVHVTDDTEAPRVNHNAIRSAKPGIPVKLKAHVSDVSGVKWVRLRYRSLTQFEDYRTLEMLPIQGGSWYQTELPVSALDPRFDLMYFIEVMDQRGNGAIYPDLEKETPYIVVKLER